MPENSQTPHFAPPPLPSGELVFTNPAKIGLYATLSLGLAALLFIIIIVTFFLSLLVPNGPGPGLFPGLMGGQMVGVMFLSAYGINLLGVPIRITLGAEVLTVEWLISRKSFNWNQIAELRRTSSGTWGALGSGGRKKKLPDPLLLLDDKGKTIAKLSGEILNAQGLISEIERRSSLARGASTFHREEQIARHLKEQRKKAIKTAVLGAILLFMGLAAGGSLYWEHRKEMRLQAEGIVAEAKVLRHFKFNITPRLEYEFSDERGNAHRKDVEMKLDAWEAAEGEKTIPIKYLADDPETSALLSGGQKRQDVPFPLIMLSAGLMVGLGAASIGMYFIGIADIKMDGGKLKIVRMGDVDASMLEMGTGAAAPPIPAPFSIPPQALATSPSPPGTLPPGIKAIAIFNILFGLLGMLFNGFKILIVFFIHARGGAVEVGHGEAIQLNAATEGYLLAVMEHAANFFLAMTLIVSALGFFFARHWARIVAMIAGSGQIIMSLLSVAGTIIWSSNMENLSQETQFAMQVGTSGAMFIAVLGMIYPLVLVVLLSRRSTREVYEQAANDLQR
ncbi:hypothetical protein HYR69_11490 [Candidatus Sumerlaeota bacterium]|nr:hypothetical protein [Candidatus Sumerlaeota bacterium]